MERPLSELVWQSSKCSKSSRTKIFENEFDIKNDPFTIDELKDVLIKVPNQKACGLDNISGEVWKTDDFNKELLKFCNDV
jgi:hypothetical protein